MLSRVADEFFEQFLKNSLSASSDDSHILKASSFTPNYYSFDAKIIFICS